MSEENVEIVRRMFEVFLSGLERGDPGAPFDQGLAAPDAEWRQLLDAGDDRVVALMHQSAIGKESGAPVEWHSGAVLELEDRRVTRVQVYLNPSEALEAAGLAD